MMRNLTNLFNKEWAVNGHNAWKQLKTVTRVKVKYGTRCAGCGNVQFMNSGYARRRRPARGLRAGLLVLRLLS